MIYDLCYLQLLEELQLLPSIQQLPIPMSSALGRQEPEENLWIRSMVLKLGNLSKPRGSSKLDIVEADSIRGTRKNKTAKEKMELTEQHDVP